LFDVITEGPLAAVVEALGCPMPLDVTNPLADAIALILGYGRQDREDQLADAIA
jgi:hypothetical protein